MNRITYAINRRDGFVISRIGSELAWPVYQFSEFGKDGDFTGEIPIALEQLSVYEAVTEWKDLLWTKKIPVEIKNLHRVFWGMKPLPAPNSQLNHNSQTTETHNE